MKTTHLALGGILTALTMIFLYLAAVIETNTIALLTLASFMVPIGLLRGNLKTAFLIYISSALLSFLMLPLKVVLLYCLFFGIYGIIKFFAERTKKLPLEIVIKLIFFNGMFFILTYLMQILIGYQILEDISSLISKYLSFGSGITSLILIWIVIQLAFAVFDYALTILIDYYYRYFARH